jgi:hypothetical protein
MVTDAPQTREIYQATAMRACATLAQIIAAFPIAPSVICAERTIFEFLEHSRL